MDPLDAKRAKPDGDENLDDLVEAAEAWRSCVKMLKQMKPPKSLPRPPDGPTIFEMCSIRNRSNDSEFLNLQITKCFDGYIEFYIRSACFWCSVRSGFMVQAEKSMAQFLALKWLWRQDHERFHIPENQWRQTYQLQTYIFTSI